MAVKYSELITNEKKIVTSSTQLKQLQSSLKTPSSINDYITLLSKL